MKRIAKPLLYLTIIAVAVFNVSAQNAAKNWVFGNRIKVDFNGSSPVASTLPPGTINTGEGTASISDSSGNLLFYTDGVTVWSKNNSPMQNGTGLMGHDSSTQSALIVPCSCDKYLLFTTGVEQNNYANGLRYSVVNMLSNGNLGEVVLASKNTLLLNKSSEKIAAVRDGKGGFWVVAHPMGNDAFYSYHIATGGDCTISAPVVSNVGTSYTNSMYGIGQMKISPDGTRLATAVYRFNLDSFLELFQFNIITGVVSNLGQNTVRATLTNGAYGVEFSPNSQALYATTVVGNNRLFRYDISLNTLPQLPPIHTFPLGVSVIGALQLAPDGQIYMARINNFLSIIPNPNAANGGWINSVFYLAPGSNGRTGLPSMIAGYFSCEQGCCDTMKVAPYPKSPLNQDYRTFEIFNPAPDSPICSIDINMTPLPHTKNWQGGQAFQNLGFGYPSTSVNFTFASVPPAYRRIPTVLPNMMSAISNPQTSPAVVFNLGFDNTKPYNGSTTLTVNHCDGRKCVLEYKPWIVNPESEMFSNSIPWSINIRELSAELSELTLTYEGRRAGAGQLREPRGARWLGVTLTGEGTEIYSIDGPEAVDEKRDSKKLNLRSSTKTATAALFEFDGLLSIDDREQAGRSITLLVRKREGTKIDPKQVRLTLFDENANRLSSGVPR